MTRNRALLKRSAFFLKTATFAAISIHIFFLERCAKGNLCKYVAVLQYNLWQIWPVPTAFKNVFLPNDGLIFT